MTFASAASIRRAVKSAQRSRTSSTVQNAASRISRSWRTTSSIDRGVVLVAVEDQAERVVPATPRRQPVGEQENGRPGWFQGELLGDLAGDREPGGLADLDDAAGKVQSCL